MSQALLDRLTDRPLLADGAMGTMLYTRGVPLDACLDGLNVLDPRMVQAVHREYVAAGADCLETNTFGANRFKLAASGHETRVREINRQGARLCREVRETMGRDVLVLGSVGPLGKYLAPLGTVTEDEAREAFREQAEAWPRVGWTASWPRPSPTSGSWPWRWRPCGPCRLISRSWPRRRSPTNG